MISTSSPHTNACSGPVNRSTGVEDDESYVGLTPAVRPAENDEKMLPRAEASAPSADGSLYLSACEDILENPNSSCSGLATSPKACAHIRSRK